MIDAIAILTDMVHLVNTGRAWQHVEIICALMRYEIMQTNEERDTKVFGNDRRLAPSCTNSRLQLENECSLLCRKLFLCNVNMKSRLVNWNENV